METSFHIYGCRGSAPVSSPGVVHYGGATTCCGLWIDGALVLFDAGSGVTGIPELQPPYKVDSVTALFTHFHLDHVCGLGMLNLHSRSGTRLKLWGSAQAHPEWQDTLRRLYSPPLWPAELTASAETVELHDLESAGDALQIGPATIRWMRIPHPQSALSYRIQIGDAVIVFATDHELNGEDPTKFEAFCAGATVLIHDAQYLPEEMPEHRGHGHSTWMEAAEMAKRAGVQKLVLTHHDPERDDDAIDAIVTAAREIFPNVVAAHAGMCAWSAGV